MSAAAGTVIVTGASRGIGAAVARLAGARGYAVAVNYRAERDQADAVVADIEKLLKTGDGVLWLTDRKGRRIGVPVVKVAYVEVGAPSPERRVGFGAP